MLRKKEAYAIITPIPRFIPRQLALDILHSHSEVITLNPLVLDHKPIPAPRTAAADEYYSTWYEITERVQLIPGAGRIGSSKITFNGCFHDMPWGLQTHIYAPFNIDLRNKYRVGGNQPGVEEPEVREMGLEALGAPKDGLYLREDIEIRCNISLVSFVKAQLKASSKEMVQRIIRKAELLDAGVLQAMMSQDGRLKTVNPNDRSQNGGQGSSPNPSPLLVYRKPSLSPCPGNSPTFESGRNQMTPPPIPPKEPDYQPQIIELPGDFQYQQSSPGLHSNHTVDSRWSQGQTSPTTSEVPRTSLGLPPGSSSGRLTSPGTVHQSYVAELPSGGINK